MPHALETVSQRFRHVARSRLSESPALYLPMARRRHPGPSPQVLGPATELVIDGYTRCGSTFAVYAFQLSQRKPVLLAHHLHAPAQLIEAARRGLPTLVLIRHPEQALLSQIVREPHVRMRDALVAYSRFYECLQPYRSRMVAADFEEVIRDFGSVTRRLNARFGTSFDVFLPTPQNVQRCFDAIRLRDSLSDRVLRFESGLLTFEEATSGWECEEGDADDHAWLPSPVRSRAKTALESQWTDPSLRHLRARAEAVYSSLFEDGSSPRPDRRSPGVPQAGAAAGTHHEGTKQ